MYLSFSDIIGCILKAILIAFLFAIQCLIMYAFYNVGCMYCDLINVPYDFAISVASPGMALEVAFILTVIELGLIVWLVNKLQNVKFIKKVTEKLSEIM